MAEKKKQPDNEEELKIAVEENQEGQAENAEITKEADELSKLKKQLEQTNDLLLRTAAEFDNYKKRTEREKANVAEYAKANLIKPMLPVIDSIDRSAAAEKDSEDYLKGIEMIVKQFEALIPTLGISEIAEVGDTFDPNLHDAVMHVEDENYGENEIIEVLQKGYKIGETVIRPAMVKVAN